ncbi:MAG: hypothetical protein LUH07_00355 [Lachnospiraceae bacterium]|nr:hypothetical protein [Lachnospiraceae bacterium]
MENRIIFREMLTELKAAAEQSDGVLTQAEVREILKSMPLEENHFQLIYDYLAEQNIRVVKSKENSDMADPDEISGEERRSLSLYVDELSALTDGDNEEEIQLISLVQNGDSLAKERLIELYLPLICTMAEEYGEEVLPAEDLIQEGNMGLLNALEALGTFDSASACRVHILNTIRDAMEKAVRHSEDFHRMDDGLVSRINHLNEAVHNLERDLGHRVSAEEVSAYLEMPMEEIENLLRVAGDQIETGKQ